MCSYQTLFHNDEAGYVIHCLGCNSVQIAFGNVMLTWHRDDFSGFCHYIQKMIDELPQDYRPNHKSIVIPFPCDGIKVLVSPRELQELHQMLDVAESELKSLEFMQLFEQQ